MYNKDSKRDCRQLDILEPLVGLLTVACSCLFLCIACVSRLDCLWRRSVLATVSLFPKWFPCGSLETCKPNASWVSYWPHLHLQRG